MSKHVTAVLTDLRARREALTLEAADLGKAIAVLERMNGGSPVAPPPAAKPSVGRRGTAPARRSVDGASNDRDARKAKAREQYEAGEDTKVIAKQAGVSTASIYLYAKAGKWKRPKMAASAAAVKSKPGVEQLSGRVRCQSCEMWTETDPCSSCGKPLKRGWR